METFVRDNKKMTNVTISKSCYSRLKRNFNFEYSFVITARKFLKKKREKSFCYTL